MNLIVAIDLSELCDLFALLEAVSLLEMTNSESTIVNRSDLRLVIDCISCVSGDVRLAVCE